MSSLLRRSGLRHHGRHPGQLALSVLGVALGVAVVVAIDLANQSAVQAFTLSSEAVTGRTTHQIVGGPAGLDEVVYPTVRVALGVRDAAPIVEGDAIAPTAPGRAFRVLGIDPFAERPFRPYLDPVGAELDLAAFLTVPGAVLLSAGTADQLGLRPGDTLALRVGAEPRTAVIVGTLDPADEISRRALEGLLVADISTAQELLGMPGRLSRIDLIVPDGGDGAALRRRIEAALPAGAAVIQAAARTSSLEAMTRAFRLNLTALSLLALVFGMFLIYNSVTFSVVRRRGWIGMLRALGVTRREILGLVLGEAAWIGVAGGAIGLLAGIVLGRGLVGFVIRTINDLYFTTNVRELAVPLPVLAKGAALGIGATLLAALAPALEAANAPPRATLTRSALEDRARRVAPRVGAAGSALSAAGVAVLLIPGGGIILGFGGLFAVIIGLALLTPMATVVLVRLLRPAMGRAFGVLGRMAARGVVTSLSRTAPAMAALVVAVAVTVGLGIMIDSFRHSVAHWLDRTLQADLYVSAPSPASNRSEAALDPELVRRIVAVPGVVGVTTYRGAVVESADGPIRVVALDADPRSRAAFTFTGGRPDAIWTAFDHEGAIIVSEPFAYRHSLAVGSRVRLRTDGGVHAFPVVGVFTDYGSDQGVIMVGRETYDRYWDDPAVSSLAVFAAPDADADALTDALRTRAGSDAALLVRSSRALRDASLRVFDRTFAITAVLRLLAFAVALIGTLSALTALQLERARELAVLRASGLTPGQLWRMVAAQTGLMGLVAGILAVPVGFVLAVIMVFAINRRSFGWTLQLEVPPGALGQAVSIALIASLLAGLYPAYRMSRTPPAAALREE